TCWSMARARTVTGSSAGGAAAGAACASRARHRTPSPLVRRWLLMMWSLPNGDNDEDSQIRRCNASELTPFRCQSAQSAHEFWLIVHQRREVGQGRNRVSSTLITGPGEDVTTGEKNVRRGPERKMASGGEAHERRANSPPLAILRSSPAQAFTTSPPRRSARIR